MQDFNRSSVIIDIETTYCGDELNLNLNKKILGHVGLYVLPPFNNFEFDKNCFYLYTPHKEFENICGAGTISQMEYQLEKANQIFGYNILSFDLIVLKQYIKNELDYKAVDLFNPLKTRKIYLSLEKVVSQLPHMKEIRKDIPSKNIPNLYQIAFKSEGRQREEQINAIVDHLKEDIKMTLTLLEYVKNHEELILKICRNSRIFPFVKIEETIRVPMKKF